MTPLKRRALTLIADNPGELDVEAIAAHLFPAPRFPAPVGSFAQRAAAVTAWRAAVTVHRVEAARKAGRLLGRLQEAGLVETRGPVVWSAWFRERVAARGFEAAMRSVGLEAVTVRAQPERLRHLPAETRPTATAMLLRRAEGGDLSTRALMAGASGAEWKAWRRVVEVGVLVPPLRRVATERGRAVVEGWRADDQTGEKSP